MIRPATLMDITAINTFDVFAGNREAEVAAGQMLVWTNENLAMAYIAWDPTGFVGNQYITYLCVSPDFRRQKIATQLIKATSEKLEEKRIFISTEADNTEMLQLLETAQWIKAGAIEGANQGNIAEVFFFKN